MINSQPTVNPEILPKEQSWHILGQLLRELATEACPGWLLHPYQAGSTSPGSEATESGSHWALLGLEAREQKLQKISPTLLKEDRQARLQATSGSCY